jgi:hypothetical protein
MRDRQIALDGKPMTFHYRITIDVELEHDPLGAGSSPADLGQLFDQANWRRVKIERAGNGGPESTDMV